MWVYNDQCWASRLSSVAKTINVMSTLQVGTTYWALLFILLSVTLSIFQGHNLCPTVLTENFVLIWLSWNIAWLFFMSARSWVYHYLKKKKSETELTTTVLEKRSKTHKRLKECLLMRRNRTKHTHFRGSPLFQAVYNKKPEKQTIQLILCQLDVGGLRKENCCL